MTRTPIISRGAAQLLLTSFALACGSWFFYVRNRPVTPLPDATLAALAEEAERLRANTDAERDSWHQRRDSLKQTAWTRAALDDLSAISGNGWRWIWPSPDRASVESVNPQFDNWPAYLAFVDMIARRPGVSLDELEVRTVGIGRERRFIHFRLGLRFLRADEAAGGPAPAPSPPGQLGLRSGSDQTMPPNNPTKQ